MTTAALKDVQNTADDRGLPIDQVGISGLRYPVTVLDRQNTRQKTVATLALSVNLPQHLKGTHMSRFIEILNAHRGELTMRTLPGILHDLCDRLDAQSARVEAIFPYFIPRTAPVSGACSVVDYECSFSATMDQHQEDFVLGVKVPVTTLCPCSKTISDRGAHNQRGTVDIHVRSIRTDGVPGLIWIEELVDMAEQSASAPVYSLLKRPDERHVTMQAFDSPVFVEDVVRNVATRLMQDPRVAWCKVHVVNQESIHNHDAFAELEWTRPSPVRIEDIASSTHEPKR